MKNNTSSFESARGVSRKAGALEGWKAETPNSALSSEGKILVKHSALTKDSDGAGLFKTFDCSVAQILREPGEFIRKIGQRGLFPVRCQGSLFHFMGYLIFIVGVVILAGCCAAAFSTKFDAEAGVDLSGQGRGKEADHD